MIPRLNVKNGESISLSFGISSTEFKKQDPTLFPVSGVVFRASNHLVAVFFTAYTVNYTALTRAVNLVYRWSSLRASRAATGSETKVV